MQAAQGVGFCDSAARVMARGAVAPDSDNYDDAAAHAQTANDDTGKPTETKEQAEENSKVYLKEKAAKFLEQLNKRHFEAALYALGYSIHTIQDFAAHKGMTNAEHSILSYDYTGISLATRNPDDEPDNIAKAETWTVDFLVAVQGALGAENWRQLTSSCQFEVDESPPGTIKGVMSITPEGAEYEKQATSPNHPDKSWISLGEAGYYFDYYYGHFSGNFRPEYVIRWAVKSEDLETVKNDLIRSFTDGLSPSPSPPANVSAVAH